MSRLAHAVATTFGLGDRLPAPGTTAGSLPAALLWAAVAAAVGVSPWLFLLTTTAFVAAVVGGIWASQVEIRRRGRDDPGPVVIDEVAGQWLTYLCALPFWAVASTGELAFFVGTGFLLFRVFDVVKPWPVSRLERLDGGLGVMADDLGAGLLAGLVLVLGRPWILEVLQLLRHSS